ncbi:MAG: DUF3943 domain-containing protein [Spirochaetes bacterium]|nr:DUF3943 domain-containing protein [Spirochaetota bacterium]
MKTLQVCLILVSLGFCRELREIPVSKPNLLVPTAVVVGTLGLALAAWTQVNPRISQFEEIGWDRYVRNITRPPRWDHDYWVLDYIAHPLVGSETFLLCRNEGFPFFTSLLFSAASSALWEFGFEAVAERPSVQDLILTPLIGSLIGEFRFQSGRSLRRSESLPPLARTILCALIDPIDLLMAPWRAARARSEMRGPRLVQASGGPGWNPQKGLTFDLQTEWSF